MKYIIVTCFLFFTQITIHAQTQLEMNIRSAAEAKKADAEMTKAYKEAMSYQDEKGKKLAGSTTCPDKIQRSSLQIGCKFG